MVCFLIGVEFHSVGELSDATGRNSLLFSFSGRDSVISLDGIASLVHFVFHFLCTLL